MSAALPIFLFSFFLRGSVRTALFEMFECLSLLYLALRAIPLSLSGSVCVAFSRARSLSLLRSLSPPLAHARVRAAVRRSVDFLVFFFSECTHSALRDV